METNDIDLDDIGALFMKNSSPNVTLGTLRLFFEIAIKLFLVKCVPCTPNFYFDKFITHNNNMFVSFFHYPLTYLFVYFFIIGVGPNIAAPSTIVKTEPKPYFWQPTDDSSFAGSTNPWSTLSSSVPAVGATSITTYNTSNDNITI